MNLIKDHIYFLQTYDAVLRTKPSEQVRGNASNQLIMGDELQFTGQTDGQWAEFYARKSTGWLKKDWIQKDRMLEVNFVDIGQGDGCHLITPQNKILLIDAGEGVGFDGQSGDHMLRFLSWRHDLRKEDAPSISLEHVIASHPDLDHYYGFLSVFDHPKIAVERIGHNGIVERSLKSAKSSAWMYDLGRKVPPIPYQRSYHLWDTVTDHETMIDLLNHPDHERKFYIKTLKKALEQNPAVQFEFINRNSGFLGNYDRSESLRIEVLGPITETVEFEGETRECLPKIGDEGETKNGHSIVLKLTYGHLKMLLGGDLNQKSMDYLTQKYTSHPQKMSDLENTIQSLKKTLRSHETIPESRAELAQKLEVAEKTLELLTLEMRSYFNVDIAKACHHGSSNILDGFLMAIHPIATVISSGDNESYAHPRPDALGAYGKCGRGVRPLIFSTELARSTAEFSYPIKFYHVLKKLEERMHELARPGDKAIYQKRMENLRDSNVVRYGLITVRSDGEKVIIAQKLETSAGPARKWDFYRLKWNEANDEFESE